MIQRLTENVSPVPTFETQQVPAAPPVASQQGEFTRIIARDEVRSAAPAPAAPAPATAVPAVAMPAMSKPAIAEPKVQVPVIDPGKAVPKPAPLAVSPPKSKLQEMVPILLVLNAFLLVVVIVVLVFALLRR